MERGRGRGHRRTPTRGRGQTPGPASTRAVTLPPTDAVVREGENGENEQVQDEELPPQPTPEMINQVLTYLRGYLIRARHLQCFLHQHLRFRKYDRLLLRLPVWMPHWK